MSGYQINLENFEPLDKQEEVTAEEEESSAAMQEMLDIIEKVKETEEKTVDNEKDNEDESDTSAIVFSQDNQELYDKFFKD
jgi:glutaredoxin 2